MVGVEFDAAHNEVVGNVYDAEFQLSTPRNPAMLTSMEASGPRSPASFANWRRRSPTTRASDTLKMGTGKGSVSEWPAVLELMAISPFVVMPFGERTTLTTPSIKQLTPKPL